MKICVTSAAQRDLVEAYDWYERWSIGLGKELVAAVDTVFDFIRDHPHLPRILMRDLRRITTKRFPYAIYYQVRGAESVRVVAILHTARDQSALPKRF